MGHAARRRAAHGAGLTRPHDRRCHCGCRRGGSAFGFREEPVAAGGWDADWQEFVLPYEEVRITADPAEVLSGFLQSTYDAAANLADWDRVKLEREPVAP